MPVGEVGWVGTLIPESVTAALKLTVSAIVMMPSALLLELSPMFPAPEDELAERAGTLSVSCGVAESVRVPEPLEPLALKPGVPPPTVGASVELPKLFALIEK